ncbi:alpha/beta hydrolase [Sphingopyxis sp.]|uniref:alpha/beta hydrolase n=1 Tax=Sphingopyxis sp. TaxID=1908224 RepID=UPI003D0DCFC6
MTALHVALYRLQAVAAVVDYSGMLAGMLGLSPGKLPKPSGLLVNGTADRVVPIAALNMSESELKRLDVDVTTHVSHGVAHTVDPVGLRLDRSFLAQALAR